MKTSDFDYPLPPERIAQTPVEPRHNSRLLVLRRGTPELEHSTFFRLGEYLRPGDLLVINRTRVIPARVHAFKPTGGRVELLLLRREDDLTWEALVGGKGMRVGKTVTIPGGPQAEVIEVMEGSRRRVRFSEPVEGALPKIGEMPLPPYIHTHLENQERYQTVYADQPGSAAAPTAGLHFTPELLDSIRAMGVHIAPVLLHVGLGTFRPVKVDNVDEHVMHVEHYEVTQETADIINAARAAGHRCVCVGTTSVRTLETVADENGLLRAQRGETGIFITPGYRYKVVDALITNFHLPESTLLILVSALMGREEALRVYDIAVREQYRFFSFGDCMMILNP